MEESHARMVQTVLIVTESFDRELEWLCRVMRTRRKSSNTKNTTADAEKKIFTLDLQKNGLTDWCELCCFR